MGAKATTMNSECDWNSRAKEGQQQRDGRGRADQRSSEQQKCMHCCDSLVLYSMIWRFSSSEVGIVIVTPSAH